MKKLIKKIYFYLYCKYVDIKVNIEHYSECKKIIKNKEYTSSYFEPCCNKTAKLYVEFNKQTNN
jgi:hypothetical protein